MESVSSMESLEAMIFYEEDIETAYMAVRNSVAKSELGKEHLELESNQLEDHINDIHDCQQDPDNFEINGVCIGQEEEEEEDEGNASKVDEGGTTVCGITDVRNDENGEITAKTGVHVQTQQTSVDVKCAKQDGGNSSKSMTKIWGDIPSNEDRDGIAKIEGVPEQAQGTTGPGVPGGVIRISNLKKGKGIADVPNDEDGEITAKTGVHVQTQQTSDDVRPAKIDRGNSSKINEESMTKTWSDIPSNEDRNGIAKIEAVPEQAQGTTGPVGIADVRNDEDGETAAKTEVHEQTQATSDDVRLAKIDRGNSSKINEESMTKTWSDILSNEDRNGIAKIEAVPEQTHGTTGPVCNDIPQKQQDAHINNLTSSNNTRNRNESVNAKQAGEEVEKGGGNTPKMEEDLNTSTECEDSDDINTPKMDGATENSKERQDGVNTSDVNGKQAGKEVEREGGNHPKMEEDLKTRTDAVNTPEMDSTSEDSKEEGQNGGNIPTVVNAKQVGEEVEKGEGNPPKMEEDFKTRTETVSLESDVEGEKSGKEITSEVDEPKHVVLEKMNVCNNGHEGEQEPNNLPSKKKAMDKKGNVNDKQADEEEEKGGGGGDTAKMEADLKSNADAVNTPGIDGATEDSKEEGQDGGNIPTVHHYSKQVGEEEEQGGGNTPNIEQDFKTSIDHNSECDSEQDADNSPSCLKGTKNRWSIRSCVFRALIILLAIHGTFAMPTKPSEYAADLGNIKKGNKCDSYASDFTRFSRFNDTQDSEACIREQESKKCPPRLKSVCLFSITKDALFAGCMNPGWLSALKGKDCPRVIHVKLKGSLNKYKVECHENECNECSDSDSDSTDTRLSKCLQFESTTTPRSTTPVNSGNIFGKDQLYWIRILAAVYLILKIGRKIGAGM